MKENILFLIIFESLNEMEIVYYNDIITIYNMNVSILSILLKVKRLRCKKTKLIEIQF